MTQPFFTLKLDQKTPLFKESMKDSNKIGETNDCWVRAIQIACDVTYIQAHRVAADHGREDKKGLPHSKGLQAIESLGFKTRNLTKGAKSHGGLSVRTLARILPTTGTFVVGVARHVLTIKDGNVEDFTKNRWHRVIRVTQIYKGDEKFEGYRSPIWKSHLERGSVGPAIWAAANEQWAELDRTTNKRIIRAMRLDIMDELAEAGFNRNTVSVELGKWWADAQENLK